MTLTGSGGCGKTRLALEVAADALAQLPDGAWFVDLASLSDPALVAQAAALAVGVPIPASRSALEALVAHLATREALIVLDNCEHLIDACACLAEEVLRAGPGVRVLATSREPLRCADEVAWRVPSLAEAERLFCERAAAARPGFDAADGAAGAVQEICRRLDGMPLAIELAAARAAALSLDQIAARLGDSLDVLGAGRRTALTRQQTLRATIDWSHDLLTGEERVLFRRLAVFAGGFRLEAAEEVCAGGAIARRRVVDLLARLVEKSLVVAEGERFRLLDTVRQYAAERLEAAAERDTVGLRYLDWCLALAEEHDPLSAGPRRSLQVLESEHDNLRAGLAWALRRDPQAALRLATRLWRFWLDRGFFAEGNRWLQTTLAAAPEQTPRASRRCSRAPACRCASVTRTASCATSATPSAPIGCSETNARPPRRSTSTPCSPSTSIAPTPRRSSPRRWRWRGAWETTACWPSPRTRQRRCRGIAATTRPLARACSRPSLCSTPRPTTTRRSSTG